MNDQGSGLLQPKWQEERWSFLAPFYKSYKGFVWAVRTHRWRTIGITLIVLIVLFAERPYLQPLAVNTVIYLPGILAAVGAAVGFWFALKVLSQWLYKDFSARFQALGGVFGLAVTVVLVLWGPGWHDFFATWLRYRWLRSEIVELNKNRPYWTKDDRALPLGGVYGLLKNRMTDNESPASPDFVKVGESYSWTSAVEPAPSNIWGRFTYDVTEFINISATSTLPDFSRRSQGGVNFDVGENLLFSRNIDTCVKRSFGPWRFVRHHPGNVLRIKDDSGAWVYAVSLVRWSGVFFPWPEFGGVQIIKQNGPHSLWRRWLWEWPKHVILGCGYWIPPEEVWKHAFLRGQNIVPYEVSRFMAESNRFQAGILGPTRYSRQGDVRIADVAEDLNLQPYVIDARVFRDGKGKLYQWFGLEPYSTDKCGLAMVFLVPGDGIGPKYRYNFAALKESPIGPSCVADRVRANKDEKYWANRRPAEAIPYVHDIEDANGNIQPRFMYKTVIVTHQVRKGDNEPQFIPATPPETYIVEPYRESVVLFGVNRQKWDDQLREVLGPIWAGKEP